MVQMHFLSRTVMLTAMFGFGLTAVVDAQDTPPAAITFVPLPGYPGASDISDVTITGGVLGDPNDMLFELCGQELGSDGIVSGAVDVGTGEFKTWGDYKDTTGPNGQFVPTGAWETFEGVCSVQPVTEWFTNGPEISVTIPVDNNGTYPATNTFTTEYATTYTLTVQKGRTHTITGAAGLNGFQQYANAIAVNAVGTWSWLNTNTTIETVVDTIAPCSQGWMTFIPQFRTVLVVPVFNVTSYCWDHRTIGGWSDGTTGCLDTWRGFGYNYQQIYSSYFSMQPTANVVTAAGQAYGWLYIHQMNLTDDATSGSCNFPTAELSNTNVPPLSLNSTSPAPSSIPQNSGAPSSVPLSSSQYYSQTPSSAATSKSAYSSQTPSSVPNCGHFSQTSSSAPPSISAYSSTQPPTSATPPKSVYASTFGRASTGVETHFSRTLPWSSKPTRAPASITPQRRFSTVQPSTFSVSPPTAAPSGTQKRAICSVASITSYLLPSIQASMTRSTFGSAPPSFSSLSGSIKPSVSLSSAALTPRSSTTPSCGIHQTGFNSKLPSTLSHFPSGNDRQKHQSTFAGYSPRISLTATSGVSHQRFVSARSSSGVSTISKASDTKSYHTFKTRSSRILWSSEQPSHSSDASSVHRSVTKLRTAATASSIAHQSTGKRVTQREKQTSTISCLT
jgi:hypothetical protein